MIAFVGAPSVIRFAGDVEGHPFHGNQWTSSDILSDSSGQPMTVYHGSTSSAVTDATMLNPSVTPVRPRPGQLNGVYFTSNPEAASGYTRVPGTGLKGPKGRVIAANIRMKNPLDITKAITSGQRKGLSFGDAKREALKAVTSAHDAVIFRGDRSNADEYLVFSRDQILRPTRLEFIGAAGPTKYGMSKWAADHAATKVSGVNKKDRAAIRDIIRRGAQRGASTKDVSNDLYEHVDLEPHEADVIARTELKMAKTGAQLAAWQRETPGARKRWVTADPCPICAELEGRTIPLDAMFEVDGDEIDGPPAHPNCQCDLELVEKVQRRAAATFVGAVGDLPGHEFHGNQYATDPTATPSEVSARVERHSAAVTEAKRLLKIGKESGDKDLHKAAKSELAELKRANPRHTGPRYTVTLPSGLSYHITGDQLDTAKAIARHEHGTIFDHVEGRARYASAVFVGAGDVEGHEFHGNQWTDDSQSLKGVAKKDAKAILHDQPWAVKWFDFWKSGGSTFFHGTQDQAIESIRAHGLVPQGGKGADTIVPAIAKYTVGDRAASVFMFEQDDRNTNVGQAAHYARMVAGIHEGAKPVILAIRIPKEIARKATRDEQSAEGALRIKIGRIPSSWIRVVDNADAVVKNPLAVSPRYRQLLRADGSLALTAVIMCKEHVTFVGAAGDLPGHEFHGNQYAKTASYGEGAKVKKGPDFSFDGDYHVTFASGEKTTFFHDKTYRNWESTDKRLKEDRPFLSAIHTGKIWANDRPTLIARLDAHFSHGMSVNDAMRLEQTGSGYQLRAVTKVF
jgi:hypothetical protein